MSVLSNIADAVIGGGFTGVTTVITGLGQGLIKLKERGLELEHTLKMQPYLIQRDKYELRLQENAINRDKFMAEQDLLERVESNSAQLMGKAIESDMREAVAALNMKGQKWWVGAIRTLNRPFLTWMTLLAMYVLIIRLIATQLYVPQDYVVNPMLAMMATTLAILCEASFGFWFGSRAVGSRRER